MAEQYDVIVIGAGPGGATLAALCARAGRRVLLVEKNDQAGGKALTLQRKGYGYEMWPVIGIPGLAAGQRSRYEELLEALDATDRVPVSVPTQESRMSGGIVYRRGPGDWLRMGGGAADDDALGRFQATFDLTAEEVEPMVTMGATILGLTDEDVEGLRGRSVLDYLDQFGLPAGVMAYIGVLLNMFFLIGPDRIPAPEGVEICLKNFVLVGGASLYFRGGIGRVLEVAADYVGDHGGAFVTKAKVERILVEGNRVAGIQTSEGTFRAPVVVSNAGIQPTVLKLAGPEHFSTDYVEYVRGLEPSWGIVGHRYFLDAPVFPPAGLAFGDLSWWDTKRYEQARAGDWPDVPQLYWSTPALWDPGLAPGDGSQVVLIGTLSDPDPESPMSEDALARSHEAALDAWPSLERHLAKKEAYTTRSVSALTRDSAVPGAGGECIGIAQTMEQEGPNKPNPRTPLEGLYIVGCDAGGKGVATHMGVDSGFRVAEMVLEDLGAGVPA
ncbi:MAG: NAD(P)/FAD-dependent oxidoreductase [Acidimicrobiia bacterium]|nr:NAD(P)/FAD-dependent oxidoreductase [Acidimicrobiia bacterium]